MNLLAMAIVGGNEQSRRSCCCFAHRMSVRASDSFLSTRDEFVELFGRAVGFSSSVTSRARRASTSAIRRISLRWFAVSLSRAVASTTTGLSAAASGTSIPCNARSRAPRRSAVALVARTARYNAW